MTQRPDLFGACLPAVGVMDMLRFHKFTEGRTWVDDYGSSDDPQQFKALLAYSPYHNLQVPAPATRPTLITTADTRRPGGSRPQLQVRRARCSATRPAGNPVLIRITNRAGHGIGKPLLKRIADWPTVARSW